MLPKKKILGIVIDNKLNFKSHLKICAKGLTKNSMYPQEYQNCTAQKMKQKMHKK